MVNVKIFAFIHSQHSRLQLIALHQIPTNGILCGRVRNSAWQYFWCWLTFSGLSFTRDILCTVRYSNAPVMNVHEQVSNESSIVPARG